MLISALSFSQWTTLNSGTTNNLQSVYFTDANTGYVVGGNWNTNEGIILKTINAGNSWTNISTGSKLYSVYFTDMNTGYSVGDSGTILKTTNAGLTWTPSISPTNKYLKTVYFANANIGYAVGDSGIVIKTTDAGVNWNIVAVLHDEGSTFPTRLASVRFTNTNTGFIISSGEYGKLYKTIDGGINWTAAINGDFSMLNFVYFTTNDTGYIPGCCFVLQTYDGGNNWNVIYTDDSYWLSSLCFVGQNIGYAVGWHGAINKTNNAGNNWVSQVSGTNNSLNSIFFTDANTGYSVGENGTIIKTTTGGLFFNLDIINGGINDTLDVPSYPINLDAGNGWQSYSWSNGSNNQTTQVTSNGWYIATVSSGTKFTMTDSIYVILSTGVNYNNKTSRTNIYPNPSNGQFCINLSEMLQIDKLEISNILGENIYSTNSSKKSYNIDISSLPNGIYFVKTYEGEKIHIDKIIKQ